MNGVEVKAGYGIADITPLRPMSLCGFAARCNAPFEGVDDPLHVRALAFAGNKLTVVILCYDLLALGPDTTGRILEALRQAPDGQSVEWILCATHTHSAPAAIILRGCGIIEDDYRELLIAASLEAARHALNSLTPVNKMRWMTADMSGQSYNRRRLLDDGRVSMARKPPGRIVREGPNWPGMLLVRFDDESGRGIVGIASWPCHPCTVCGPDVTADFPGELCSRLTKEQGLPFVFLQGAGGNINPFFEKMTRGEMLRNVDNVMKCLADVSWPDEASSSQPVAVLHGKTELRYGPSLAAEQLGKISAGMEAIAQTGEGPAGMMTLLGDILNWKPGAWPPKRMTRHLAATIREWSAAMLALVKDGVDSCQIETCVLRLGKLVFAFVAAEPFVETQISLQDRCPDDVVTVVGYKTPAVGYLPTDQALEDGGYEVDQAYRFYNRPAPFAKGSEQRVVDTLVKMIRKETKKK